MNSRKILILTFILALGGCDSGIQKPAYQLQSSSDGKIYRLNLKSGEVDFISSNGMTALTDQYPIIHIGSFYEIEDAKDGQPKFLKYLGNGQFEKSEWAIKKIN